MIALLLALAIAALGYRYGLYSRTEAHGEFWAIAYPFITVIALLIIYSVARAFLDIRTLPPAREAGKLAADLRIFLSDFDPWPQPDPSVKRGTVEWLVATNNAEADHIARLAYSYDVQFKKRVRTVMQRFTATGINADKLMPYANEEIVERDNIVDLIAILKSLAAQSGGSIR